MTDSLFDQQEQSEPQIDPNEKYYEKLVGPEAKFKDQEALAKGKWYSDQMIEIQNKRMDQMREQILKQDAELKAAKRLEDILDQLDTKASTPIEEPKVDVRDNRPAISPEDIDERVAKKIAESKAADRARENFNTVMSKLKERYGTNYRDVLVEKTEELGLTADDINALARKSPSAFFRTMGLDQMPTLPPNQSPPRTTSQFAPMSAPKKTWTYYQQMFKKDPKLYYDAKVTNEMVQSMTELGDAFKDGDFAIYGD
jgi:hypothetical protein